MPVPPDPPWSSAAQTGAFFARKDSMTQEHDLWRFTSQAWLPLAGFTLTLALALFVLSRRCRSRIHLSFAALNGAAALWNLDVFLLFTLQDRDLAGTLDRLFQVPIVSIPFLGLLFIFSFLEKRWTAPVLVAFGLWTAGLWVVSLSPGYITGWERYWFGYYGKAGRWYVLFPVTHVAYLLLSCRYLYEELRVTRDHLRRNQIAYLLMANLALGLVSLDNFGPLFGVQRLPLGNVAVLIYFTVMAVTIVRFRLLDIQVLFRYGLLYSSLTFVLSGLYLLFVLGLQSWFQVEVFSGSLFLPMLPALALAFAFGPVRDALQEKLDRSFFRSRSAMRTRLADFSATAGRGEDEKEIWEAAWDLGWRLVNPVRAAVMAARGGGFCATAGTGFSPGELEELCRFCDEEEVEGVPVEGFEVSVPVWGKDGLLGLCLLGQKRSGEPYTREDLEFLDGIAGQSALALERVRLLEESRNKERLAAFGKAAAVVSHEMRNPLSVIRGALALLRSRISRREGLGILQVVEEEIRKSDRFMKDFLAACREPRPQPILIDLNALLKEIAARWKGERPSGALLVLEPAPGELPVRADVFQLSRVILNLVQNADDAAGDRCMVRISSGRSSAGEVMVAVSDNGPGIDPDLLPRIFEPFCTGRRKGTGLGLSIARGIIEAHGGRIEAGRSHEGGALFRLRLPPGKPLRDVEEQ